MRKTECPVCQGTGDDQDNPDEWECDACYGKGYLLHVSKKSGGMNFKSYKNKYSVEGDSSWA